MNNLKQKILDAIESDDSFTEKNNEDMIDIYKICSRSEKFMLDHFFIALCGYSVNTLIERHENEKTI